MLGSFFFPLALSPCTTLSHQIITWKCVDILAVISLLCDLEKINLPFETCFPTWKMGLITLPTSEGCYDNGFKALSAVTGLEKSLNNHSLKRKRGWVKNFQKGSSEEWEYSSEDGRILSECHLLGLGKEFSELWEVGKIGWEAHEFGDT